MYYIAPSASLQHPIVFLISVFIVKFLFHPELTYLKLYDFLFFFLTNLFRLYIRGCWYFSVPCHVIELISYVWSDFLSLSFKKLKKIYECAVMTEVKKLRWQTSNLESSRRWLTAPCKNHFGYYSSLVEETANLRKYKKEFYSLSLRLIIT